MMRRRMRPEIVSTRIVTDDDDEDRGPRLREASERDGLLEHEADAAGADDAEDGRGADVDLEAVQPERDHLGQDLGQDAPALDLDRRARRSHRAASTGPGSMPSIASAVSLPSVPAEWTPIASAPATGPSPAMGMKIATARMISGKARMALSSWRMTFETRPLETFFAPKKPSGSESAAPMIVPTQAICSDSIIASSARGR